MAVCTSITLTQSLEVLFLTITLPPVLISVSAELMQRMLLLRTAMTARNGYCLHVKCADQPVVVFTGSDTAPNL